jgi:hypothetical protein
MDIVGALSLILMACSVPLCELGISFLRRIYTKKSPFRGDKLHLHNILKSKYKFSASKTSSCMAITSTIILSSGFILAIFFHPFIALVLVTTAIIYFYISACLEEWQSNMKKDDLKNIFTIFEGKTVNIVDSAQFYSLDIVLVDKVKDGAPEKKKAA